MHGILVLPAGCDHDEWLTARQQGIGASEIAVVLGISPYDSPFSLYWRKKLGTQIDPSPQMEWGTRLEDAVAAKFADNHPDLTVGNGGLYRHPDHDWMLATPDRLLFDGIPHDVELRGDIFEPLDRTPAALLELKTAGSLDDWGDDGTDHVPVHYRAQVIYQLDVLGLPQAHIAVLCRGSIYREYVVEHDAEDAATMRKAGEEFMRRLADNDPPDIDGSAATAKTIKALHPDLIDEPVTVPLPVADQYRVRAELLADAQAAYDEAYNQLLAATGNYRYAVADGRKVATRSVYDQTRLDTKRLKKERPVQAADLYAAFGETTTVSKLTPTKENP